jgi:hypothetical protein
MKANISHSDNKEFGTPHHIYNRLCQVTNIYPTLDICATKTNTKCIKFITKEQDAFNIDWTEDFWANIPFGAKVVNPKATKQLNYGLVAWVKRILDQTKTYDVSALVLLPLSSSIIAKFYQYCEVIVIENRITFLKEDNTPDQYPISKDLMCLVFRNKQNKINNRNFIKKLSAIRI